MLNALDIGLLVGYIILVLAVGCGSAYVQKRRATGGGDGDFFLASRKLLWPIIGLSLFSTNISTVHIVALAEQGYLNGLAFANFELAAVFTLVILAVFFVPFYLRSHVTTLPDFLEQRFSRPSRDFLAFVSIISAIFIHIGTSLYAGGIVINSLLGLGTEVVNIIPTMIVIALATGLYVAVGGLLAVTLTDAIQTTTLIVGSCIVTYFAYTKLGGWQILQDTTGPVMNSVLRSSNDPSGLPWHAVLLGYPIIGIWYWCTDQTIVQRVLGAKSEDHGKAGALFAGFLKLLPMFIFVLPGLICLALINTGKLPPVAASKDVFAHMVLHMLPAGLRGLVAAALLAALMGTIAGALNSIATLFAYDLYKRFKPQTPDRKLVHIGRIATVVGIVVAIVWSPIIGRFDSIYGALASMVCYIAPPITAVFVIGIFWKRATAKAATVTLWSGFALGLLVFGLDLFSEQTGWSVLFMHSAAILCAICCAIMVVVSLMTENRNTEENLKLVWDSPMAPLRIKGAPGLMNYKVLSIIVLIAASALYYAFREPSAARIEAWELANPEAAAKVAVHRGLAPDPAAEDQE